MKTEKKDGYVFDTENLNKEEVLEDENKVMVSSKKCDSAKKGYITARNDDCSTLPTVNAKNKDDEKYMSQLQDK